MICNGNVLGMGWNDMQWECIGNGIKNVPGMEWELQNKCNILKNIIIGIILQPHDVINYNLIVYLNMQ